MSRGVSQKSSTTAADRVAALPGDFIVRRAASISLYLYISYAHLFYDGSRLPGNHWYLLALLQLAVCIICGEKSKKWRSELSASRVRRFQS